MGASKLTIRNNITRNDTHWLTKGNKPRDRCRIFADILTLRFRGARFFKRPIASALLATDYFIQTFNYADKFLRGSTRNLFSDSFGR